MKYCLAMSNTEISSVRDTRTGQFLRGHIGMGGRPRGSRNLLSEAYLADLRDVWATHGRAALVACAEEDPGRFCAIFASLLPRELDVDISVTRINDALAAYRLLQELPNGELRRLQNHADDAGS
jgi:hypothetical protein